MKRLNLGTWKNIFRNVADNGEEVEVVWLDNHPLPSEYALVCDCELFEDGFATEQEAINRLNELEEMYDSNEFVENYIG